MRNHINHLFSAIFFREQNQPLHFDNINTFRQSTEFSLPQNVVVYSSYWGLLLGYLTLVTFANLIFSINKCRCNLTTVWTVLLSLYKKRLIFFAPADKTHFILLNGTRRTPNNRCFSMPLQLIILKTTMVFCSFFRKS